MTLAFAPSRNERRTAPQPRSRFPRLPLYSALAFIGFAFAAIVFGQVTEIGTVRVELGEPTAIRDITIAEGAGQRIAVHDAATGTLIASYAAEDGGFVRGSLRGLNRMRLVAGVPESQPYRLIRWDNGAISLSDTGTGERLYLDAFGPDNAGAFAELLDRGRSTQ